MLTQTLAPVVALSLAGSAYGAAFDSYDHLHARDFAEQQGKQVHGTRVAHLFRRSGTCQFPDYEGMVAVQSGGQNGGWALSSDQQCSYGSWCPYACQPGQLMAQWDSSSTSYSYPQSQYGGLYCDENGNLQKSRSDQDYCTDGTGTVRATNNANSGVSFCQTVLPGNEEMLIPTSVDSGSSQSLAVPGPDYWAGTAAHYYVNAPGVSTSDACQWGSSANAQGNWAPYVAGMNTDSSQNTFVKIGWNPVYLESSSPFRNQMPDFGIKVTCDDESSCTGLPCGIDPSSQSVNEVSGDGSAGDGGAQFCVVTVKNGAKASIEVFDSDGNSKSKRDVAHHGHAAVAVETVYKTVTAA
ncbi:LAMI_0C09736g1_1 [Lachancea mirantina]|uniref:LAMI_0C09736g1_1 n=1 Tax=Lachancea mirantina TaxID=1230905 RepID=A0A1G4J5K3_9SACH|nr:LAMI_0C09736g1_1 [Lachancea mirantina]